MIKAFSLRFATSLCLLLFGFSGKAQSQRSFERIIVDLQEALNEYSLVGPYHGILALDDFSFCKKEKKLLKKNASEPVDSKDSISALDLIWHFQDQIFENLDALIHHSRFEENELFELLNFKDTDLHIARSEDKKLYSFSLDEKTGGTYRSRLSFMYYSETDKDSLPSVISLIDKEDADIFHSDGYGSIHSLETVEGTKYVLSGFVRGCSYCFETYVQLVSLKDEVFHEEFKTEVYSRSWEGGASYDHEKQRITVDYETDDLTTDCNCDFDDLNEDYDEDAEDREWEKSCFCLYAFNGITFELMESSWQKIPSETSID